jgi:hypothetical protein
MMIFLQDARIVHKFPVCSVTPVGFFCTQDRILKYFSNGNVFSSGNCGSLGKICDTDGNSSFQNECGVI